MRLCLYETTAPSCLSMHRVMPIYKIIANRMQFTLGCTCREYNIEQGVIATATESQKMKTVA